MKLKVNLKKGRRYKELMVIFVNYYMLSYIREWDHFM